MRSPILISGCLIAIAIMKNNAWPSEDATHILSAIFFMFLVMDIIELVLKAISPKTP